MSNRDAFSHDLVLEREVPISHWKSILRKMKGAKHSEMVAMLKTDHEMGHGHANAIVAHFRAEQGL